MIETIDAIFKFQALKIVLLQVPFRIETKTITAEPLAHGADSGCAALIFVANPG